MLPSLSVCLCCVGEEFLWGAMCGVTTSLSLSQELFPTSIRKKDMHDTRHNYDEASVNHDGATPAPPEEPHEEHQPEDDQPATGSDAESLNEVPAWPLVWS